MQNPQTIKAPEWTILKLLEWATTYFRSHDIDSPRATAEILLAHGLKMKRIDLYLRYDQPLINSELAIFKDLVKRRIDREPVAYIVGIKEFWSRDLKVTRKVLIPRPETECLVEQGLYLLSNVDASGHPKKSRQILEIGTGTGAIMLALIMERPGNRFFATDHTFPAIEIAKQNIRQYAPEENMCFIVGDMLTAFNDHIQSFDLILSNPPYIPTGEIDNLQPEISRYEPRSALDGGENGLFYIAQIIQQAYLFLKSDGYLLLEIGYDQKKAVQDIIDACHTYEDIRFIKDYSGHDRIVQMKKKFGSS